MKNGELIASVHYYMNDEGLMVFTRQYHLEKGYCCGMGCLHCPYEYEAVPEPVKTKLTEQRNKNK
ncbi:MAG: hypothetical protein B6D37_14240 [Sphingobacteriales bacterium UTBCD1]|jgi:hypothetical protein|nr:MAG: hypothetical protein B6D37_14240 [Sphingobacteriales bacterium UTBCD1]